MPFITPTERSSSLIFIPQRRLKAWSSLDMLWIWPRVSIFDFKRIYKTKLWVKNAVLRSQDNCGVMSPNHSDKNSIAHSSGLLRQKCLVSEDKRLWMRQMRNGNKLRRMFIRKRQQNTHQNGKSYKSRNVSQAWKLKQKQAWSRHDVNLLYLIAGWDNCKDIVLIE